jgi:hypothetical protein
MSTYLKLQRRDNKFFKFLCGEIHSLQPAFILEMLLGKTRPEIFERAATSKLAFSHHLKSFNGFPESIFAIANFQSNVYF